MGCGDGGVSQRPASFVSAIAVFDGSRRLITIVAVFTFDNGCDAALRDLLKRIESRRQSPVLSRTYRIPT
ncbi:hypothetical protein TAL182_PC00272 (plasmid) [Rhizobium sp. TAL182]|nr:hypothetical protein TAL182_PC00272 [Rhizobium sp. TAL182]